MYGNMVHVPVFFISFIVFELIFFNQMVHCLNMCVLLECVKLAALKVESILYVTHSLLRLISNVNSTGTLINVFVPTYM